FAASHFKVTRDFRQVFPSAGAASAGLPGLTLQDWVVGVRVGVFAVVLVGGRVGVRVCVGVGTAGTASTEPTSHARPCGRETPRWSLVTVVPFKSVHCALSIAALPAPGRCVFVNDAGPALLASGPRFRFVTLS